MNDYWKLTLERASFKGTAAQNKRNSKALTFATNIVNLAFFITLQKCVFLLFAIAYTLQDESKISMCKMPVFSRFYFSIFCNIKQLGKEADQFAFANFLAETRTWDICLPWYPPLFPLFLTSSPSSSSFFISVYFILDSKNSIEFNFFSLSVDQLENLQLIPIPLAVISPPGFFLKPVWRIFFREICRQCAGRLFLS